MAKTFRRWIPWFLCALGLWALSACSGNSVLSLLHTPTIPPSLTPIPPTPTLTPSPTLTYTPTRTRTFTASPTRTFTPTASVTPTFTRTPTPTITEGPSPTPTPYLSPTRTPTRTITLTPTRTITPTRTNTGTPTKTFTPTPPLTAQRIERPGPYSKVNSPFQVRAVVNPGDDGKIWLDLIGEDGRFIKQDVLDYTFYRVTRNIWTIPKVDFKISGAAEYARLVLTAYDGAGRKISVNSVDLILITVGDDDINPPATSMEAYVLRTPLDKQVFRGGVVGASGVIRSVNSNPVIFELINLQNKIVGSTQLQVPPPPPGMSHTPFEVAIPYSVEQSTNVRLTIRQESDTRIPGTVALASLQLYIEP